MVRLSLWQIGQLVSYVKTLFNLNIIRHIKLHYSIRLTFQNLQRANMSSPKHACGGTCRLDSQLLTASTFHTNLHLSSSCSSNRLLKKWCVDDMTVAIRHKIVIRFLNYTQTNTNETHNLQQTHMSSTKHACGGTCWLDFPFLLYPRSVPNARWATVAVAVAVARSRSSRVQSSYSTHRHRIASGGTFYGTVYPALQPNQTAERVVEDMTVADIDDTKE